MAAVGDDEVCAWDCWAWCFCVFDEVVNCVVYVLCVSCCCSGDIGSGVCVYGVVLLVLVAGCCCCIWVDGALRMYM